MEILIGEHQMRHYFSIFMSWKRILTHTYMGEGRIKTWPATGPRRIQNPASTEQEVEWAKRWKVVPKLVFSRTLDQVEWNARVVRDNIVGEITALKAQKGKHISLGGAKLAKSFIKLALIDEYHLYIHPIILGGGTPLFPYMDRQNLKLIHNETFPSGVVHLRYQPQETHRDSVEAEKGDRRYVKRGGSE